MLSANKTNGKYVPFGNNTPHFLSCAMAMNAEAGSFMVHIPACRVSDSAIANSSRRNPTKIWGAMFLKEKKKPAATYPQAQGFQKMEAKS